MLTFNQTVAAIERRRSVFPKSYEQGEISNDLLIKLLDAAKWAPTHKNTQPWFFIVFQEKAKIELVEKQINLLFKAKGESDETRSKAEKMLEKAHKSAAIIAVVMKRDEQKRVPDFEEEWSVACAVQNMHTVAPSLGLGCYWSTGASTNQPEMRAFLELKPDDRHMGWFFVGKFTGEIKLARERNSWEEFTIWKK